VDPERTLHDVSTDASDWDEAQAGDGRAFARVFRRDRERVRRHAIAVTGSVADAEDVVAVTFFEAWRHRDRVRFVDDSLEAWLVATATNVARNLARSSRRYSELLNRLPEPEPSVPPGEEYGSALPAIRDLPPREREVVALCLIAGYGEREAAAALGIPPGTVKSRLSRARRRLQATLRAEGLREEIGHV
jgi:RNA polymerase sigma factor (sigma-70 family)